ncbi:response regulator transcription factor [Paraburkholderia sp. BL17N1]|uniref:response regulator n=1 Tax=Paraburkholderia sp. BL17N1 TaxID=1938798 RepID=UPI000EB1F7EC|nr:response regulator transcription factor [Paraburkholderia sp. BL17N1]RKR31605.1 LuxR family two component transcriptional regulator [Paraburkholderia sp. BL17N1]
MSGTIYLVDDHAVLRDGLRALLEPAGYRIVGEGWIPQTVLQDIMRAPPDVVLLDLSLGEHSGLELLGEMHRRKLPSRVLVLSMLSQPRQVLDAVRMGAMGYVLKGSKGGEVIDALRNVLAGRHYWSAEIAATAQKAMSSPAVQEPAVTLSLRERQVLNLVVRGRTSASIAESLHLSVKTVETYRLRLMRKLGVSDITGLMRLAFKEGMLDAEGR